MGAKMTDTFEWSTKYNPLKHPRAGFYQGWQNRSIVVDGNNTHSNLWVHRDKIRGDAKRELWKIMEVEDYKDIKREIANKTCLEYVMEYHQQHPFPSHAEIKEQM